MKNDWLRRARRLFPAMFLMLIVLLAVSWTTLLAETYARLVNQTLAVLLFGTNIYFYLEADYFASAMQDPLLHCWSLAVEEQYYILFPVLLRVLWWAGGKRCTAFTRALPTTKPGIELVQSGMVAHSMCASDSGLGPQSHDAAGLHIDVERSAVEVAQNRVPTACEIGAPKDEATNRPECGQNGSDLPAFSSFEPGRLPFAMIIVLLVASLAACIVLLPTARKFAFYLLPLRAWELLLGSVLAFDRRYGRLSFLRGSMVAAEVSCAVGLAMIVVSYVIYDGKRTPWPSYPTLLPTVGTALFLASQEPHPKRKQRLSWCGKFLSLPPFAFIGEVSYSLYLWHWPVYLLLAYTTVGSKLNANATALGIFVSLVAGCVSLFSMESALIRSSTWTPSSNPMLGRVLRTLHLTRLSNRRFTAAALVVWSALFTFVLVASVKGLGGAHSTRKERTEPSVSHPLRMQVSGRTWWSRL
jgi:peptidoglycan/LPS O-acetylase OafA/YrhL